MKVEIKDDKLIVEIDCDPKPTRISKSGKSLVVATTNGNVKTDVIVNGKSLVIGLNAYIYID
jgi:hypothetical protein